MREKMLRARLCLQAQIAGVPFARLMTSNSMVGPEAIDEFSLYHLTAISGQRLSIS